MTFVWPLDNYIVTRNFYYRSSVYVGGQHAAIDLIPHNRPATGEPIRAVADWIAVGVGWDFYSGFFVALDHEGGFRTFYRHLYGQTPVVIGQRGKQGDIIGNVGNTGYSLGAHLHFDLWNRQKQDTTAFYKNGWWAHDPELYLGQEDTMTYGEFKDMLLKVLKDPDVGFQGKDSADVYITGVHPLEWWLGKLHEHREDNFKHSSGSEGLKRGDKVTLK